MSRLSEILGVEEGQEFTYTNNSYICKIENGILKRKEDKTWVNLNSVLCLMIKYPENIRIIPTKPKLTEQQLIAIKGRIAEGWKYIVRDSYDRIEFFETKPKYDEKVGWFHSNELHSNGTLSLYDFLKRGECLYLPDLIGGSENE